MGLDTKFGMPAIKNALFKHELELWELVTIENLLKQKILELEDMLSMTNQTIDDIAFNEKNALFRTYDSIKQTIIQYETELWKLVEFTLQMKAKFHFSSASVETAAAVPQIKTEKENNGEAVNEQLDELDVNDYVTILVPVDDDDNDNDGQPARRVKKENEPYNDSRVLCFEQFGLTASVQKETSNTKPVNDKYTIKCMYCNRDFENRTNLLRHIRIHAQGQKEFACEVCNRSYSAKRDLTNHQRLHTGDLRHECKICGERFAIPSVFSNHKQKHRNEGLEYIDNGRVFCRLCEHSFKSVALLRDHMSSNHDGAKPYACERCGKCFDKHQVLKKHRLTHGNDCQYECYMCHENCPDKMALTVHLMIHWGDAVSTCENCDKQFPKIFHLDLHRKYCFGGKERPKKFLCSECGKGFYKPSALHTHMRSHSNDRNFQCEFCSKRYTSRGALRLHNLSVHTNTRHECNLCHKEFRTVNNLKRHKNDIHDRKEFSCHICGRKYADQAGFKNHMRIHTNDKRYVCTDADCDQRFHTCNQRLRHVRQVHGGNLFECAECKEQFSHKYGLIKHMVKHKGMHECTDCSRKFVTISQYTAHHRRVHLNVRKFACNLCDKTFYARTTLDRHMMIHTGEKPFACEVCGARFADAEYVAIHMRLHTGERPFACSHCDKRFMDQRNLKKHIKSIHSKAN